MDQGKTFKGRLTGYLIDWSIQTDFVLRPDFFAAFNCALSDDTKRSAFHSTAHARCKESIARSTLLTRRAVERTITEGNS